MFKFKIACKTYSKSFKSLPRIYMLRILIYLVECLSNIHKLFWRKMSYKTQECCQIWEGSASHVPIPPTKSTKRVGDVHKVNNNINQLLSMSHSHVQHTHPFCITKYTYYHWVFYLFFSHLNLVSLSFVVGYTLLPPLLDLTTWPNHKGYLG